MPFRNPTPRHWSDIGCFLTILILLPIGFLFDMLVVLPAIHEPNSYLYNFTLVIAIFIFLNIEGNMFACMLIDTSVKLPDRPIAECDQEQMEWRFCKICDRLAPPRSWHCSWCGVCMLKRDHHCGFTACCIGHLNHRNFVCFVFYVFVGSVYALVYNTMYIMGYDESLLKCWKDCLKTQFPRAVPSCTWWVNFEVLIYLLNLFTVVASSCALVKQVGIVSRGQVSAKRAHNPKFNRGVYYNLRSVFGQRMLLTWIYPFIESRLPDDGYSWEAKRNESIKPN